MPMDEFYSICSFFSMKEDQVAQTLKYLTNIGSVIYDPDLSERLGNFLVIDPVWILRLFTSVVMNTKHNGEGVVRTNDLTSIWNETQYPIKIYDTLFSLLLQYEVVLDLDCVERRKQSIQSKYKRQDTSLVLNKRGKKTLKIHLFRR